MSFVDFSLSLSIYLLIDLSLLINPFLSLDQSIDWSLGGIPNKGGPFAVSSQVR